MASTYSALKIELIGTGEQSGTWGTTTNTNLGTALEEAITGRATANFSTDADLTLGYTDANTTQTFRNLILNVTSGVSLTATRNLIVPTIEKQYLVENNTTGSQSIVVKTTAGTGITIPNGKKAHVYADGTNVVQASDFFPTIDVNGGTIDGAVIGGVSAAAATVTNLTASGTVNFSGATVSNGGSVTTIDINGGTIDGTTIGGASAAAGTFTTLGATTGNITTVNATTVNTTTLDLTNLEVTNIKAKDGTAAATIADATGKITVSTELAVDNLNLSGNAITSTDANGNIDLTPNGTGEVNISKVDIDSGAIDGTTIGANSAAAGTFTTLGATTGNITTLNATDVNTTTLDLTNIEVTNIKAKDGTAAGSIADSTGVVTITTLVGTNDATISGLTVGKGAGAVSTNTAVGASALAANTTGADNTAFGLDALTANTTGDVNAAFGSRALLANTTGTWNVAVGKDAMLANTTGGNNVAIGRALASNTTASDNTALGYVALYYNTTGANNTAVGSGALFVNTTASNNTAVGYQAGYSNTTAIQQTFLGAQAGYSTTTGLSNTAIGFQAFYYNTTGTQNVAVGLHALLNNTTASNNTAVGYQAGYSNTTGSDNIFVGRAAGYSASTGQYNTVVGLQAGYYATGNRNTFIGFDAGFNTTGSRNTFLGGANTGNEGSGYYVTTGSANTILGNYNGNQGGLDIRTASNYIVLSDGDGNPRAYWNGANLVQNGAATFVGRTLTTGGADFTHAGASNDPYGVISVTAPADSNAYAGFAQTRAGNIVYGWGINSLNQMWFGQVGSGVVASNQRLQIDGGTGAYVDRCFGVGNTLPSTSGAGITFPATQSASSNANTLDDYEEGTWTPGLSGSFTYTSRTGKYTKIGNTVTITGDIIWASNSSGSTSWAVTGLPFTVADNRVPATLGYMAGVDNIGGKQIIATTSSGQTSFDFWAINDNAAPTNIDASNISSTGEVQFSIVYHTST